jgi:hypothetical protein
MSSTRIEEWIVQDRRWVSDNFAVVQGAFQWFMDTGEWPEVRALKRKYAQAGQGNVDVSAVVSSKPTPPGLAREVSLQYLKLGVRHLLILREAAQLLNLLVVVSNRAVEIYRTSETELEVGSDDPAVTDYVSRISRGLPAQGPLVTLQRLPKLVVGDYPSPVHGGMSVIGEDRWSMAIDEDIVLDFEDLKSPADYAERQGNVLERRQREAEAAAGVLDPVLRELGDSAYGLSSLTGAGSMQSSLTEALTESGPLLSWSGEILIPEANIAGYKAVFEAETWLRRLCLAALLLAEGPAWAATLSPGLRSQIEDESQRNAARWYLGVDAEEELLWATTQGQLRQLFELDSLQPHLRRLCGLDGSVLCARLASVGQIRNALAHSRAISNDTLTILQGDLAIVRAAVQRFKRATLYVDADILLDNFPSDLSVIGETFVEASKGFPRQQLFLSATEDFVFFVRLPVEPFGRWPHAARLRESLDAASHLLLCVLANMDGNELQLVVPRALPDDDKLETLRRFMTEEVLRDAWTDRPPASQHPADICWPKLWFYENRRPER